MESARVAYRGRFYGGEGVGMVVDAMDYLPCPLVIVGGGLVYWLWGRGRGG